MAGPPDTRAPLAETAAPRPAESGTIASSLALDATTAARPALDATTVGSPALDATTAGAPPSLDADPVRLARASEAAAPERIGRFIVLREVGRGAMGVVFAAYDEELDRKVALKLVELDEFADASLGRNQLLREAQALARFTHPNIVAVHEAGVHQGAVFFAMEFVDGVDLHRWLAAAPRAWRDIVGVFLQAGEGLAAAHRVGLVHRDFKPTNVLVGDDGRVRVADFGLAARRDGPVLAPVPKDIDLLASTHRSARLAATLAGAGALVGTPAYMAPEQLRREAATAASDQFAFCIALHEALFRRRPFVGDDLDALTGDVLTRELPPAPPDASVPAWLYALVRRGLARDPAARFPDMRALLAELARDPDAERARRRQRLRQLAAAVAVTLLVVLGAVSLYRSLSRAAHERRADARLAVLRDQLAGLRADGRADEAARAFAAFVDLPDNRGTAALARAYQEWAAAQTDHDAALDALAAAYVHARDPAAQRAALRGIALRLGSRGAYAQALTALATLDARDTAAPTDPALAGLRTAAALDCRDLPAATAALARLPADDPLRPYGHVLEHLSHATAIDHPAAVRDREATPALGLGDLDGDGRPEVLWYDQGSDHVQVRRADAQLTPISALPLGDLTAPDGSPARQLVTPLTALPRALAGEPLLLVGIEKPGGGQDRGVRYVFLPPTPGARPVHEFIDSPGSPAAGDLDGDGLPELYLGVRAYGRHLLQVSRGPDGGLRQRSPHPRTDAAASDVNAVAVGDLDGDGRPELVAAVGAWTAYDVRVLRARDDGELELVARRTLGYVPDLALVRDGDRVQIAAIKLDDYANPHRFPRDKPSGEPAGLYVLELAGDALEVAQFVPARDGDGPPHEFVYLRAADLDADGRDDLTVRDGDGISLLRRDGGRFTGPLYVADARLLLIAPLDDDPEAELLVLPRTDPSQLLALGAGDAPTPALPRPTIAARPVPEDITDPAAADAWRLAEDLAAIGLPRRAADELAASARLSDHVDEDMLLRSGELFAAAGAHAAAADQYLAAADRPDLAAAGLAGAVASRRALRELAAAEALAERRAALPDLAPEARAAAEAELAALRRATADRPGLSLRFDRALGPGWRIADPLALTRDPGTRALVLDSASPSVFAELPLEWDGGSVGLTVEAEIEHIDWSAELKVALLPAGSEKPWLAVAFAAGGLSERPVRTVTAGSNTSYRAFSHELPAAARGRVRVHFRHDPELDAALVEYTLDDQPTVRTILPLVQHGQASGSTSAAMPIAPPVGPLRLALVSSSSADAMTARVRLRAIDLLGLRPAPPSASPQPDVGRLITEVELDAALAGLAAPADPTQALWRAVVLARLGRTDEAARALADLLRDLPADAPARARLFQLLRGEPDPLHAAARRALGPALDDLLFTPFDTNHPWRPATIRGALADLAQRSLAPPPGFDPVTDQQHVVALVRRGLAWLHAGRLDLARRDLEAAWLVLDDPARDFPRRKELRSATIRKLLHTAIQARDAAAARRWLSATLAENPTPELALEMWRSNPELGPLLSAADWAAVEALARSP